MYRTVAGAVHRLVAQVGPIEHVNNEKKKQLATMLFGLRGSFSPRSRFERPDRFVSMWLESKTLTGPDAEYVRLQSSQFIESTLKGYEEEARPASSEIINHAMERMVTAALGHRKREIDKLSGSGQIDISFG